MLRKLIFAAVAAATAARVYGWLKQHSHHSNKRQRKEALQVWEGEGGNPLPPQMPAKTVRHAAG